MLKIGEFSRLSQVTVKTLHHYDELGLIKPAHIDPVTNYRFYTVGQLPRIHRIMALKEMGLSLEQIGIMLEKELPTDEIRGMLHFKQAEIQQEMREAQRQLSLVEFRLRMIEAEINFPELDVVMKRLEPMRFLSFFDKPDLTLPMEELLAHRERVAATLRKAIEDGVIKHTGVVYDVYHGETIMSFHSPEIGEKQHEILIGVTDALGMNRLLNRLRPYSLKGMIFEILQAMSKRQPCSAAGRSCMDTARITRCAFFITAVHCIHPTLLSLSSKRSCQWI